MSGNIKVVLICPLRVLYQNSIQVKKTFILELESLVSPLRDMSLWVGQYD